MNATANEVRAFARGYASAVEAHCLSLLHRLEELYAQRRYGATRKESVKAAQLRVTAETQIGSFPNVGVPHAVIENSVVDSESGSTSIISC